MRGTVRNPEAMWESVAHAMKREGTLRPEPSSTSWRVQATSTHPVKYYTFLTRVVLRHRSLESNYLFRRGGVLVVHFMMLVVQMACGAVVKAPKFLSFSPASKAQHVSPEVQEIILNFDVPVTLGTGTITLIGSTSKVLRLPYIDQQQVLHIRGSYATSEYVKRETNMTSLGLGLLMAYDTHGSLSPNQIRLLPNGHSLVMTLLEPLRAETSYEVVFPATLVNPAIEIPKLNFATVAYDKKHPAQKWSFQCDPWKYRPIDVASDYVEAGAWDICPVNRRSVSGCGDFDEDARYAKCDKKTELPSCENNPIAAAFLPTAQFHERQVWEQHWSLFHYQNLHRCFNQPILYDELFRIQHEDVSVPPSRAPHRDNWGKSGEYEFLPAARWSHNLEHGAVSFLYDACMDPGEVCKLRSYALSKAADLGGPFRWVMTPYISGQQKRLDSPALHFPLWVCTYGYCYAAHCFSPTEIDRFLDRHYRDSIEDFGFEGYYDYLWTDATQAVCDTPLTALSASRRAFSGPRQTVTVATASLSLIGFMYVVKKRLASWRAHLM